jgi:hypothetical protein
MTAMVTESTNNNIRTIFSTDFIFLHEKRDYVFNDWKEFERE